MRTQTTFAFFIALFLSPVLLAADAPPAEDPNANTLTDAEKAVGWTLLFDGKTTNGWHRYSNKSQPTTAPVAPTGWVVENGVVARTTKGSGDLVTDDEYENFELTFQWKISSGGNSGVIYRCTEDHKQSYETGPEYQVLD